MGRLLPQSAAPRLHKDQYWKRLQTQYVGAGSPPIDPAAEQSLASPSFAEDAPLLFPRMQRHRLRRGRGRAGTGDEQIARSEAIKGARSIMADDVQRGQLDLSSFIEVEDERHELLFTLSFGEVIDVTPGSTQQPRSDRR
jgi:hypothetical protein